MNNQRSSRLQVGLCFVFNLFKTQHKREVLLFPTLSDIWQQIVLLKISQASSVCSDNSVISISMEQWWNDKRQGKAEVLRKEPVLEVLRPFKLHLNLPRKEPGPPQRLTTWATARTFEDYNHEHQAEYCEGQADVRWADQPFLRTSINFGTGIVLKLSDYPHWLRVVTSSH